MPTTTTMIQFKNPATFLVSSATQSGKTRFILHMLDAVCRDLFFKVPIWLILFCYGKYQRVFERYRSFVCFYEGLPDPRDAFRRKMTVHVDSRRSDGFGRHVCGRHIYKDLAPSQLVSHLPTYVRICSINPSIIERSVWIRSTSCCCTIPGTRNP